MRRTGYRIPAEPRREGSRDYGAIAPSSIWMAVTPICDVGCARANDQRPEGWARPPGGRARLLSYERPKWRARLSPCQL